jgi:sulfur carrier protein ThiS
MSDKTRRGSVKLNFTREKREITISLEAGESVMDLLAKADVPVDGVLVFRGNVPVPLDEDVIDVDELTVVSVASGG